MVIYRPHRELLIESMQEAKEFDTIDQMKQYIVDQANHDGRNILSIDDIIINPEDSGWSGGSNGDSRCGWENILYVCTKRYGSVDYIEKYGSPQCIGSCSTKYTSYNRDYWLSQKIYG